LKLQSPPENPPKRVLATWRLSDYFSQRSCQSWRDLERRGALE